jgi:ribonucleoside-diphosphate reductase alpha chain
MKIENEVLFNIWKDRYCKNDETIEGNLHRVAKYCSKNEKEEQDFYKVMDEGLFFPAGRTMSNSGVGRDLTLNNCFVAPQMQDNLTDIFNKVALGAKTHQKGGGIGYDFSQLRPKGSPTSNDAIASGAISFMDVFNAQTNTILQGGRRGANMGVMCVYNMDIEEFITAKSYDEGKLVHFNISVMVDNDFMNAVRDDKDIYLHYPVYDEDSKILKDESKWIYKKNVSAKYIWDLITRRAYDNGEPGIFFYENLNKDNTLWYIENIVSTNPCAEYLAGTLYGNNPITNKSFDKSQYGGACNLGSVFLHNMVDNPFTKNAKINYEKLKETIHIAVRLLDNIIDINNFPDEIYKNYQKSFRTIGLGITGLGNMLCMMNLVYGSKESVKFVDELMNYFAKESFKASIQLAKEKESFEFLNKEAFVKSGFIFKHAEKDEEWKDIIKDILTYGIRNGKILSVAPTGTMSLTFGNNCSSGLEPIFSLSYDRKVKMGGQDESNIKIVKMEDCSYKLWSEMKDNKIVKEDIFVTAMNLPVQAHLDILKAVASHIDMSCSKTVNIPSDYSFEDTKKVYDFCWENGIKGCTIFRPNPIRQGILIAEEKKSEEIQEAVDTLKEMKRGEWKAKANDTVYFERKIHIGCGKIALFIGWSNNEQSIQDLYVIRSGNGGCERNLQAMVIAMSGMLRLGGNIFNIEKAFEGVGGCNSFVSKRVKGEKLSKGSSCGTAILNEIKLFLIEITKVELETKINKPITNKLENKDLTIEEKTFIKENGEMVFALKYSKCPQCAENLEHADGCITCKSCGWTKC